MLYITVDNYFRIEIPYNVLDMICDLESKISEVLGIFNGAFVNYVQLYFNGHNIPSYRNSYLSEFYITDKSTINLEYKHPILNPLHIAVHTNNINSINLWIKIFSIDVLTSDGQTPLILAVIAEKYRMVEKLLSFEADRNIKDKFDHNALYYAKLSRKSITNDKIISLLE